MDELNIGSKIFQSLVEKAIKKVIKKKIGCEPEFLFNDPIQVLFDGNKVMLHLNFDAELSAGDLQKIIKELM